jgi:hypothetical protein
MTVALGFSETFALDYIVTSEEGLSSCLNINYNFTLHYQRVRCDGNCVVNDCIGKWI